MDRGAAGEGAPPLTDNQIRALARIFNPPPPPPPWPAQPRPSSNEPRGGHAASGSAEGSLPFSDRISVTYQDAALMTGQSAAVIRRAVRRGDLVAHYPTSKPVLLIEDVVAWIRSSPTEHG